MWCNRNYKETGEGWEHRYTMHYERREVLSRPGGVLFNTYLSWMHLEKGGGSSPRLYRRNKSSVRAELWLLWIMKYVSLITWWERKRLKRAWALKNNIKMEQKASVLEVMRQTNNQSLKQEAQQELWRRLPVDKRKSVSFCVSEMRRTLCGILGTHSCLLRLKVKDPTFFFFY